MKNFVRLPLVAVVGWVVIASAGTAPNAPAVDAKRLDQVLAGDQRSEKNRARDVYRHPRETLSFFGAQPNLTIVEIFPGDGWYTEVLAPLVRGTGKLYAAHYDPDSTLTYAQNSLKRYREKLASRPDVYDQVTLTVLSPEKHEIAPPGSADLVVTFRNMHNWMNSGYAPAAFKAMYDALKPGGVLGIEEHRGRTDQPQDPDAKSGYVREDYAIALIESVGFKLVARSEINANPKDTKDYPAGVWTLPPTYRLKDQDHAKYEAIGESDRFTLTFVKPAS